MSPTRLFELFMSLSATCLFLLGVFYLVVYATGSAVVVFVLALGVVVSIDPLVKLMIRKGAR